MSRRARTRVNARPWNSPGAEGIDLDQLLAEDRRRWRADEIRDDAPAGPSHGPVGADRDEDEASHLGRSIRR